MIKIEKALKSKGLSSRRLKLIIIFVVFIFSFESAGHCLRVPIGDHKRIHLAYSRISDNAFIEIDRKTKEILDPSITGPDVLAGHLSNNKKARGKSIFINAPLNTHQELREYYRQVQQIVQSYVGEGVVNTYLDDIHLTVATPETGYNEFLLTLETIFEEAKKDAEGKGPFAIELAGPHLTPNGLVIMEYKILSPEFYEIRQLAKDRIKERESEIKSNGNSISVPNICHSTVAVIIDPNLSQEKLMPLYLKCESMRNELRKRAPIIVTIDKMAVSEVDSNSRRMTRRKEFGLIDNAFKMPSGVYRRDI